MALPPTSIDPRLRQFIELMPKVELHLHLEGSIQPRTLLELAKRHGVDLPASDPAGIAEWYQFRDFPHFIEVWIKVVSCLRDGDDLARITRDFGEAIAAQNGRYAQVTFVPHTHLRFNGTPYDEVWGGIRAGADWVERELGVRLQFSPDFPRALRPGGDGGVENTVEFAVNHQHQGIVALGLGGYEVGNPPELFIEAFRHAKSRGLRSWPHAGETVGPASVWGAVRELGADRIAHGIRAVEDPALVAFLAENGIACDVCPTSNVCLGVYPAIEHHPIRELLTAGVPVTVNSDDPPMFGATLTGEFLALAEHHAFTAAELADLTRTAVDVCFLPDGEKTALRAQVERDLVVAAAASGVSIGGRTTPTN